MKARLLSGEGKVWPRITEATKNAPRADVAIAYFGKGGARRLPLKRGSRLVVDASEARVKTGATCPAELLKLCNKGVAIYSHTDLHAKVIVLPRRAFVGSANNSAMSAKTLAEAVLESTDQQVIAEARQFVEQLCVDSPLGPDELRKLQRSYREPVSQKAAKKADVARRRRKPATWIDKIVDCTWPEGYKKVAGSERRAAGSKREFSARSHELHVTMGTSKPSWKAGDTIIYVQQDHLTLWVSTPGRVIDDRKWSNGKKTYWFTFTEHLKQRRSSSDQIAKKLGRKWKSCLRRNGKLDAESARIINQWWARRGGRSLR